MTELADVHDRHCERLQPRDALLRMAPLEVGDDDLVLTGDGAVAVLGTDHTDPGSALGLWVDEEVVRVRLRAASDNAARQLGPLLHQVLDAAPSHLAVHVSSPSRDVAVVRPLQLAGFTPVTVVAVRRLTEAGGEAAAAPPAGVTVRPADPADSADAAALTAQRVAVHRHEHDTGLVPTREDSSRIVAGAVAEQLRERPGWSWLAERDGEVLGACEVQPRGHAAWLGGMLADGEGAAYLQDLHVVPDARSSGVGAALVTAAHAALAEDGARVVALHHGMANPLSSPFWARAGYRPLLTTWVHQPRTT